MRFILAIVSFIVAALLIGLGIAQKTVLAAPDEITASTSTPSTAPVTVISGDALNAFPRSQFVEIGGPSTNFIAYGKTTDVLGWVGDASYNAISYSVDDAALVSTLETGTESEVPTPVGSDLWLATYTDTNALTLKVPDDVSLLVVSDGIAPAPSDISVTWPLDNSTPWANTFVVAGGVLLLVGLLLLFWAIAHIKRSRGPRRKPQKMPKLPRQPRYKPVKPKPKAIDSNAKGRRSISPRIAIVPVVLVTALALGGCSADFWAGRAVAPAATASADPVAEAEDAVQLEAPAVTEQQAGRIIDDIAAIAVTADAASDQALIATRFAGPALDVRVTNYKVRAADATVAAIDAIPTGPVEVILPQQVETWPRTVLAVVDDLTLNEDGTPKPQVAVVMIQDDARSNYKANYVMRLEPGAEIPAVAPATVGAARFTQDSDFLMVTPGQIAADYGDILLTDTASVSYPLFEAEGDSFRVAVGLAAQTAEKAAFPTTASLAFTNGVGTGEVIALATNDSGALVTANINEERTATVVEAGAVVNSGIQTKALTGKATSTKGFTATYGDQLLFYVPSVATGGKIILLGYSQGIVAATELP